VIGNQVWRNIVRPIAVGGMLVGASYTLFKMRASLAAGIGRAISDLKKGQFAGRSAGPHAARPERPHGVHGAGRGICRHAGPVLLLHEGLHAAAGVAAVVMIILGFFFAAISGNLVGMIGSSNNPISGLTLSTLIIAALLMVAIGVKGSTGVMAVLGVAAVICVSSAVAGEMLQDLKVGHILGGTPRRMQIGDFLGELVASLVLYFPLLWLHQSNIKEGGIGFGDAKLSAPQAGLMASLAQGIVGGDMAWPLVIVGIFMGIGLIMVEVKSPMLFSVGMYLPLETTFAIFVGGVIRWLCDVYRDRQVSTTRKRRASRMRVCCAPRG
jgi:putative OPT family oligopeptide transporter